MLRAIAGLFLDERLVRLDRDGIRLGSHGKGETLK